MDKYFPSRAELSRLVVSLNAVPNSKIDARQELHLKRSAALRSLARAWVVFFLCASLGFLHWAVLAVGLLAAGLAGGVLLYQKSRKHEVLAELYRPLREPELEYIANVAWRSDVVREHLRRATARRRELYRADLLYVRQILVRETRNGDLASDRLPLEQTRDVLAPLTSK